MLWATTSGALTITSSTTDSDGVASARWTLGNAPGPVTVTASVRGAQGSPVVFAATALGWVTASVIASTDNQSGEVGAALPTELSIQAYASGRPAEGVTVRWSTTDGAITPRSSVTDAAGRTSTYWTMPHGAGQAAAMATVDRTVGPPLVFHATARPGPAVDFVGLWGDGQSLPANFPEFGTLRVHGSDRFGNDVYPSDIAWSVVSGPVSVLPQSQGTVWGRVVPTGVPGSAVVRATTAGPLSVDFALTSTPPLPFAVLDQRSGEFSSARNGSVPAVDTISVGGSMAWLWLSNDYNYDEQGILSIGTPSFAGGLFGYSPATYSAIFPAPGEYRYTALYGPADSGTVVVR